MRNKQGDGEDITKYTYDDDGKVICMEWTEEVTTTVYEYSELTDESADADDESTEPDPPADAR